MGIGINNNRLNPREVREIVDEANELAQIFDLPPILWEDIIRDEREDCFCWEYGNDGLIHYYGDKIKLL